MIFVSVFLLWFGCFASYLSSSKQRLVKKAYPKRAVVFCTAILLSLAVAGLAEHYGWLVSSLISLLLVMAMWLLLVIVASHIRQRAILVFSLGAVFFPSIFLLGIH